VGCSCSGSIPGAPLTRLLGFLGVGNEANSEAAGSTLTVNYIATKAIAKDSKTIKQSQAKGLEGFL